jgi:hypothetical protein
MFDVRAAAVNRATPMRRFVDGRNIAADAAARTMPHHEQT